MIGDVNVVIGEGEESGDIEVDVMIADVTARRQGAAQEALHLLQEWAKTCFKPQRFVAKIAEENGPSLALFSRLGYKEFNRIPVFSEIHYELLVAPE